MIFSGTKGVVAVAVLMLGAVRLLGAEAIALGASGRDALVPESLAFGTSVELQTEHGPFGPAVAAYGHNGAGGSVHGAWPSRRVGFSYVMNQLRDDYDDDRSRSLLAALRRSLHPLISPPLENERLAGFIPRGR